MYQYEIGNREDIDEDIKYIRKMVKYNQKPVKVFLSKDDKIGLLIEKEKDAKLIKQLIILSQE